MDRLRRTTLSSIAGMVAGVLLMGCTPDSLEGFEEPSNNANSANNANSTNSTNNTNNTNNSGTFTTEYVAVAGILRDNCLQAPCHGSAASNAFAVPSDQLATESEIRAAIENVSATTSGMLMVSPGNSGMSDIYDRIVRSTGDPLLMPQTGVLPAAEVMAIQTWIDGGAIYTE